MRLSHLALFSLLPLFTACQVWKTATPDSSQRLQGELTRQNGGLLLSTCQGSRRLAIEDPQNTLSRDAASFFEKGARKLFVDLRGQVTGSSQSNTDGTLEVSQLYRLQNEGRGCEDPNFQNSLLKAQGHEPEWLVLITPQGMLLERPEGSQVQPYISEGSPESIAVYSSEANGQKLELSVTPASCRDNMNGLSNLQAELRINDQVFYGCAYPGGAAR